MYEQHKQNIKSQNFSGSGGSEWPAEQPGVWEDPCQVSHEQYDHDPVIILINRYDINGDGVVNLEEFLVIMRQIWIYHLLNKTCSKVGPINL